LLLQRKRSGVLLEHVAERVLELRPADSTNRPIEATWNVQLAAGD